MVSCAGAEPDTRRRRSTVLPRDFDRRILRETAHRPWPMPASPWIMTQTWHDLLFAHWPVEARLLASRIPPGLDLDLFEGQAWLGIVPFRMTNVAPRGVPALPWLSAFPELNVRTYVRVEDRPGVYFLSLDAANPLAVLVARALFHLPYHRAAMHVEPRGTAIHYTSRRTTGGGPPAELVATYAPVAPGSRARPGSLEAFLTERYCLYTVDRWSRASRLEIHHPPWSLAPAQAHIGVNTMADALGLRLPPLLPLLHFSKRQDMVAWPSRRIGAVVRPRG
jgi:uncharacterized protein YqjF (DUF2071 family)